MDAYGGILESLPLGIFITKAGEIKYANQGFVQILGYESLDELINKKFEEFIGSEEDPKSNLANKGNENLLNGGIVRLLKKDGRTLWAHTAGKNIIHQEEPAIIGYIIDITPLKESELSLRSSLAKYETIINEIEDSVAEVDLKGNVTFTNDAGCRIWGHTREEAIGRNYRSFMDPESAKIVYQEYNKVFRTGVPGKNIIYEIIRKNDGQRRVIEDSVSLIRNAEGIITGFRTVSRDITERIKKEKQLIEHRSRLEAIFRSVKDAIITVDPELKIIEVNNSARIICGIASIEVPKQTFSQCFNQCNKSCYEILKQTLENKKTIQEYRIECGHQKRHQQLVSVTSSPLLDPDGKFMGAVLVIKDLTLIRDLERELRERHQFQNIIGRSKKMQDIYRLLEDLADLDTTVLISGESGTGKELVARALHYSGRRAFKPFVTVNCSALAESLLESELFGHVKGAFTGAIKDKEGRFQAANGGTIFLDEIGDISPLIQLKLLRVLQEKVFECVGESVPRKVDVRVIASTNKDLKEKVKKGEFREDLYYRLKVVEIYLPPLRERLEDIPLLVEHFINFFNQRFKKKIEGISNEVLNKFMNYLWPGKIRELEHVIEHAFVLCHGRVITNDHLPLEIRSYAGPEKFVEPKGHLKDRRTAQDILNALNRTGWNKAKAARLLRISRQTVYRKISQYKLTENM